MIFNNLVEVVSKENEFVIFNKNGTILFDSKKHKINNLVLCLDIEKIIAVANHKLLLITSK